MFRSSRCRAALWCLSVLSGSQAWAAPEVPVAADVPYPGTITLSVDLSDAGRKIFRVHETIPVRAGALALYYPKWIPGEHSPSGTINGLTGLKISSAGRSIPWKRDLEDVFTLHVDVPAGVSALELDFQFLSPTGGGEFGSSVSATPKLVDLEWNQVLFYPAGHTARQITVQPTARLAEGWNYGTALDLASQSDAGTVDILRFKPVSLEMLVDSPLIAGVNFRHIELARVGNRPVYLDLVADRPENLAATEEQIKQHRALIAQGAALFGQHHYEHYHFLFTLSDNTGHFGLEHHQSSDDRIDANFFTDKDTYLVGADLLPHEYVHSWNGKFRRPAGLATPHFNVPMKGDLLWVYEGLTQYLGDVLAVRSGMWSPEQYRDALAASAANMEARPGRSWRPLQDTADAAQLLYYTPDAWKNYQRGVDYYPEGELLWLDVDTRIRELSQGRRSLDDFVKAFYGRDDEGRLVETYGFDDIVSALNAVQPYEWAKFLRTQLDATRTEAPLDGLVRAGWKLVYTETPTDYFKAAEKLSKSVNLMHSLGIVIDDDKEKGVLRDVLWNGPGFVAGLAPGMKLVAVNGEAYDADRLRDVVKAAKDARKPIELLVQNLDYFSTIKLDYHEAPKYPKLVRADANPDRLSLIAKARR